MWTKQNNHHVRNIRIYIIDNIRKKILAFIHLCWLRIFSKQYQTYEDLRVGQMVRRQSHISGGGYSLQKNYRKMRLNPTLLTALVANGRRDCSLTALQQVSGSSRMRPECWNSAIWIFFSRKMFTNRWIIYYVFHLVDDVEQWFVPIDYIF